MPKTKVLQVISRFSMGGAERLVFEYVNLIDRKQFEIYVASVVEDGDLRVFLEELSDGVFVGSLKKHKNRWRVWREFKKYVNNLKPDVIHTHLLSSDFFGYLIKRKNKNITWMSSQHNVENETSWWRRKLWKIILKKADKVVCVSQKVKDYTCEDYSLPEEKKIVILNGIKLEKWGSMDIKNVLSVDKLRLATIGRLEKQKGHKYLFFALTELGIPWELQIFGTGSLEKSLKKLAQKLKIDDKIVWRGVIQGMTKEFDKIDAVVQPSLWEGRSLVVMEAMASGRPILSSWQAGEELVQNNETGLVFNYEDIDEIVEKIKYIWENKDEAKEMGLTARKYALENFDIKKNVKELEKLYKK